MATQFQMIITPDASLGVGGAMTFNLSLPEPNGLLPLIAAYNSMLGLNFTTNAQGQQVPANPTVKQTMQAWLMSMMNGTMNNVTSWVQQQKVAQVSTTAPTLTITAS